MASDNEIRRMDLSAEQKTEHIALAIINIKPPTDNKTEMKCWVCVKCKTVNNLSLTIRKYKMICCLPACTNIYNPVSATFVLSNKWNLCPHQVPLEYKLCPFCYVEPKENEEENKVRELTPLKLQRSVSDERRLKCSLLIGGYIRDVINDIHMFTSSVFEIIALYFEPFHFRREIQTTTQGRTYEGFGLLSGTKCLIQEAWRELIQREQHRNGNKCKYLNWLIEREFVLAAGASTNCPSSIIKGFHAWEDKHCYYYACEFWKGDLFNFVSNHFACNQDKILNESLGSSIALVKNNWIVTCTNIFRQICEATQWVHSKGFCHLGLGLEHIAINRDNLQIKVFRFDTMKERNEVNANIVPWTKSYASPEFYAPRAFDGCLADVWSLGVILFMMLIGAPPFKTPAPADTAFNFMVRGRVRDVLQHWKRMHCVTEDALDLLNCIFRLEHSRITLDEIMQHSFLSN